MAGHNSECDLLDQLLRDDDIIMPLPDFESEPHLLISKVRKHYMEYIIKLLSINYETHHKLINKNLYMPSAIWRCAKTIEMSAAQACMVVQIYRNNIITAVKQLKNDTKKGKLYKKLFTCLNKPPENDKKTQTTNTNKDNNCQCMQNKRKRRCRGSISPKTNKIDNNDHDNDSLDNFNSNAALKDSTVVCSETTVPVHPEPTANPPIDTQECDELMMQLERMFQGDTNDDELYESVLYDKLDTTSHNNISVTSNKDSVIETQAAQIKSLDERLANLTGLIVNNENSVLPKTETKKQRSGSSKWLCEEYFLKQKLYELLDQIRDTDRKEVERIKQKFIDLFGEDSDDEGILSPLDETPEFVISCKERIAPWVVKLLTPHYIKGYIKGKGIFKALAKHLIRLIYQCSKYPEEYEVTSFVSDFLKNHKTIKSEADFMEFKIENI
ncbi:unnamed protein product [Chrysodeixis includens]|uniref:Set2 Rpb1 interacting domain-containing protein n=1 Tax=Chrysodeixis includens TaxID=689277 RepID=A0A9P0BU53_CHRIL|nr:unnamed protein product [Chrysodeixis includens]